MKSDESSERSQWSTTRKLASKFSSRKRRKRPQKVSARPQVTFTPSFQFDQDDTQQRLQSLINGSRRSWNYAIFWEISDNRPLIGNQRILAWGDGYFQGEEAMFRRIPSSTAEQEHRKRVLAELNALTTAQTESDTGPVEEVTDSEWFFLVSMTHSFVAGNGLPGQALYTSTAVWATGAQRLAGFSCSHADEARQLGIQTLICIPLADGVLELGSSSLIFPDSEFDLLDRIRQLFKFTNNISIKEFTGSDSATWGLNPCPVQTGYESESSVGNHPMIHQGNPLPRDKKEGENSSDSESDSRYIEVFTQILRRGRG